MKLTKLFKSILCLVLIASMGLLPMTAFAAVKKAYICTVTGNNVRLRSGSGASSTVIGSLRKGSKVLFWGHRQGALCKVCTTSGKVGYVYRNYLSVYGAIKKSQIYSTTKTTPVYKKVGSKYKKFSSVPSGRYLLVIGQAGGLAYVRTVTGSAGYVPAANLTRVF